jgi:uncharacterized protein GlcG (DUF336 family)
MPHASPAGFQHGITLDAARRIADATLAKGREIGLAPLTVVVLDAAGREKVVLREDGSSLLRPEIARGKAYGSLGLGYGSRELARRAQAVPGFTTALTVISDGAVPAAGGVLIRDAGGAVLGAVGVSGDLSDKDEVCAVAGIQAAGLQPDTGDPA